MSLVKNEDFKITKGAENLKLYQFHSKLLNITSVPSAEYIHIIIQELIHYLQVSTLAALMI